jgi:hypothetical protein
MAPTRDGKVTGVISNIPMYAGSDWITWRAALAIVRSKSVAHVVVREAVLRDHESFVSCEGAVHARKIGQALLQGGCELEVPNKGKTSAENLRVG